MTRSTTISMTPWPAATGSANRTWSNSSSSRCTPEMVQLEHWGCPWSRKPDGHINVRAFGGMKIERTWFAADRSGFHILHTLFQTSTKYPSIKRFDEYFCVDLHRRRRPRARRGGALALDRGIHGHLRARRDPRDGRRRPRFPPEHQRRHRHRRRHGARLPAWRAAARHGIRAVPSDLHAGHRPSFHRGLPRRRRLPFEQGRLPLFAGLRPRTRRRPSPATRRWSSGRATA